MADFQQLGTSLFITIVVINFFLFSFMGVPLPKSYNPFSVNTDQNLTETSFANPNANFDLPSDSDVQSTSGIIQNDPFQQSIIQDASNTMSILYGSVFGLAYHATLLHVPQEIMYAVIWPINIFMIIFIVQFAATILSSAVKKVFG